jgi:hypothetical protein
LTNDRQLTNTEESGTKTYKILNKRPFLKKIKKIVKTRDFLLFKTGFKDKYFNQIPNCFT